MSAAPEPYYSVEDYLAMEEAGEEKHEYYRGEIYARTGASARHNLIGTNIIANLRPQLRTKGCSIFSSDLRIKVTATGLYTYPDVSVVCGPLNFDGTRLDTVTNPTVIIEVLSPSTENYDRGKKFQHYRTLESLREYLLIAQDAMRIEQYTRQDDHRWVLTEYILSNQQLELSTIQCTLPLSAIYEDVEFGE